MNKRFTYTLLLVFLMIVGYSCGDLAPDGTLGGDAQSPESRATTSYEYPFSRYLKLTYPAMTGTDVKLLQTLLNDWSRVRGLPLLYLDGSYGSVTKTRVITFQKAYGLYADGEAGPVTISKLVSVFTLGSSYISPYYRDLYYGRSGEDVKALQRAYNVWAKAKGKTLLWVDGSYGSVTKNAIITYQNTESRLYVDGYSGKQTQRLLFVRSWKVIPDSSWTRPLAGYYVSQEFKGATVHNGIDLAKAYGSTIYAARSGQIKDIIEGYLYNGDTTSTALSGWALDPVYKMSGDKIVIQHADGKLSIYDHCAPISGLYVGQIVYKDQPIGYINRSGNRTGPHIHFAIFNNSSYLSAVNPRNYIGF